MSKICSVKSQFYGAHFHFTTWQGEERTKVVAMKATRNNIKMPFLCTKGFTNGNPQIHWALKIRLDHLSRVEWSGKPTIEKSNTLKTFPSLITQLFSWLLGNRKYFHVPLYCEKLHFVLLERIFHRRNLLSTFHWFHLSQHEKIPFLTFLTQTQTWMDGLEMTPSKNESFILELQVEQNYHFSFSSNPSLFVDPC